MLAVAEASSKYSTCRKETMSSLTTSVDELHSTFYSVTAFKNGRGRYELFLYA